MGEPVAGNAATGTCDRIESHIEPERWRRSSWLVNLPSRWGTGYGGGGKEGVTSATPGSTYRRDAMSTDGIRARSETTRRSCQPCDERRAGHCVCRSGLTEARTTDTAFTCESSDCVVAWSRDKFQFPMQQSEAGAEVGAMGRIRMGASSGPGASPFGAQIPAGGNPFHRAALDCGGVAGLTCRRRTPTRPGLTGTWWGKG